MEHGSRHARGRYWSFFLVIVMKRSYSIILTILILLFSVDSCIEITELDTSKPNFGQISSSVRSSSIYSHKAYAELIATVYQNNSRIKDFGFYYGTSNPPTSSCDATYSSGRMSASIDELSPGTTYYYQAYVSDGLSTMKSDIGSFRTYDSPMVETGSSTPSSNSCLVRGTVVTDNGCQVTLMGFAYSTSSNMSNKKYVYASAKTGNFETTITGLTAGTTYYYQAFAENDYGISYGKTYSFTTIVTVPSVTTVSVYDVTNNSATVDFRIDSNGGSSITAFGLVFSSWTNMPTINDSSVSSYYDSKGYFSRTISSLSGNTTYYVRAYATNRYGTSYGETLTFTTQLQIPYYYDENGSYQGRGIPIRETVNGVSKTLIWAPVNLGYSSYYYPYGKLYQWGRKVGHGYGSSSSVVPRVDVDEAGNSVNIKETTVTNNRMPYPSSNVFYTYNRSYSLGDWYTSDQYYQLSGNWNNLSSTSYIGNPCPSGWRLPTYEELYGLMSKPSEWSSRNGQYGRYYYSDDYSEWVFLPASGMRSSSDGSSFDRNVEGYYWSNDTNGSSAYVFGLYESGSYYMNSKRANGYSIRCVYNTSN